MKSIEQLLTLVENPYYNFTDEEQKRLDDFLKTRSAQRNRPLKTSPDFNKNTPATVLNRNIVQKDIGEIAELENIVHPDAVN